MIINKEMEQNTLIVSLEGRLDTNTAPLLERELMDSIGAIEGVVLNLSRLEYISSAGLRVILKAQKSMNGKGTMKLTNVNATIREVFEITGFIDILTIE